MLGKVSGELSDRPVTINTGDTYNVNELNVIMTKMVAMVERHPEIREEVLEMLDEVEADTAMAALPEPPLGRSDGGVPT